MQDVKSTDRHRHSEDLIKDLENRMKRIQGQVKGITRMISEGVYCDDILNQISAANSALNAVGKILMEAHIKSCVVKQIQEGDLQVIDELMNTLKKLIR